MSDSVRLTRSVGSKEPFAFRLSARDFVEVNGREVLIGNLPAQAQVVSEGVPHVHLPGEPCPLIREPRKPRRQR